MTDWEKRFDKLSDTFCVDGGFMVRKPNSNDWIIMWHPENVKSFIRSLLSDLDEAIEKEKLNRRVPSKESGLPFAIYVWDESRNVYTAKIQHGDDVQYKSITKIDLEVPGAYIDPDKGFNDGLTKAQQVVKGKI